LEVVEAEAINLQALEAKVFGNLTASTSLCTGLAFPIQAVQFFIIPSVAHEYEISLKILNFF